MNWSCTPYIVNWELYKENWEKVEWMTCSCEKATVCKMILDLLRKDKDRYKDLTLNMLGQQHDWLTQC